MKPNNLYYRDILTILEPSQTPAKFYSSMYYLRRISEHYNGSYTGRKCSNKYIKDWAVAMGVTDNGGHHVNYYWIKRIAKKLVPSTADDLSENIYLRIISENITPTPVPIATTIKTYINNVEVDNTQTIPPTILSYADRENAVFKFVVTDEEDNPVEGYSIPYSVSGVDQTPMTTNANGEATYTYQSSGVGDTNISINCTLVSKTFSIRDGIFYDVSSSSNVSKYGSSSAFSYDSTEQAYYITTSSAKNITRESVVGDFDFEISMDFKITDSNTIFYCGESTSGYECQGLIMGASRTYKGVSTYYTNNSQSVSGRQNRDTYDLSNNKWYSFKVTREGNVLTAKILDGDTVIATATDSNVVGTSNNVSWHNYVQTGTMYWKNILFIRL